MVEIEQQTTVDFDGIQISASLNKAITDSLSVLSDMFTRFKPSEIVISFNGGKDSTVIVHLLKMHLERAGTPNLLSQIKTVHLEGNNEFAEIVAFRAKIEQEYGIQVELLSCNLLQECSGLIERGYKCNVVGRRRMDPNSSTLTTVEPSGPDYPDYTRFFPVMDWNYAQVWEFLRKFNVKFCELYEDGYTSLGEIHNSRPNPALKKADGTFSPAWELIDASLERDSRC